MGRRLRGALEQEVLAVVTAARSPMSVADVAAALRAAAAYTTVMTTLTRLHDNGSLTRERQGRGFVYSLASPPQGLGAVRTARRMRRLLDKHDDRANVLASFVAELDPAAETLLQQLLAEAHDEPDTRPTPDESP